MRRPVSRLVDAALFAGVAGGLVLYGGRYVPGALDAVSGLSAGRLAACSALVLAGYCLRFAIWHRLARGFGLGVPPAEGAKAFFVSFLGRYVPGNVGLLLARVRAYGGCPAGTVTLATAVEYASIIASALFLASFEAGARASAGAGAALWPLGATALILVLLHPAVLRRASRIAWRVFRKDPPADFPAWGRMASYTAGYAFNGILNGTALVVLLLGMTGLPASLFPAVIARYYVAGLAGGVAAFAPAGLGVREVVLAASLAGFAGSGPAVAAALVMRLVTVLLELLLAGSSVLAYRIAARRRLPQGS